MALSGERFDGHDFLDSAAAAGAAAAVVGKIPTAAPPALRYLVVPDTLAALGNLARYRCERLGSPRPAHSHCCSLGRNFSTFSVRWRTAGAGRLGDRRGALQAERQGPGLDGKGGPTVADPAGALSGALIGFL